MADIAKLVARLELQNAQFIAEIKKSQTQLKRFQQEADNSLKSVDKMFKQVANGAKSLGIFALAMKALSTVTRFGEAALKAAADSSVVFARELAEVEKATKAAAAPNNIPELTKQLEKLKETVQSPDYVAGMSALSSYWADRMLFLKREAAGLVEMMGKLARWTGSVPEPAAPETGNRRGSRALAGRVSSEAANSEIAMKAYADQLKVQQAALDRARRNQEDFAEGVRDAMEGAYAEIGRAAAEESDRIQTYFIDPAVKKINLVPAAAKQAAEEQFTEMDRLAQSAVYSMHSAFSEFFFDPLDKGFKNMALSFANSIRQMMADLAASQLVKGILSLFGGGGSISLAGILPGFANGGSFQVGGSGGTDSQLVAFRATPGERVNVSTPGQRSGGGITINQHVDARGATADAIALLPSAMKAASDDAVRRVLTMQKQGRI